MTWYTDTDKTILDYSKPIIAKSVSGKRYLLLPTCYDNSFKFRGYDWLDIKVGKWNSCVNWKTAEEAVKSYEKMYEISNYEFEV